MSRFFFFLISRPFAFEWPISVQGVDAVANAMDACHRTIYRGRTLGEEQKKSGRICWVSCSCFFLFILKFEGHLFKHFLLEMFLETALFEIHGDIKR